MADMAALDEAAVAALEAEAAALEKEAEAKLRAGTSAEAAVRDMQSQLRRAEARLEQERAGAETLQKLIEHEEAHIRDSLGKRLARVMEEKQRLLLQVEAEEEYLTNSLQRQLAQVTKEKHELEKHLRHERKYIVTKLQRQLRAASEQKGRLERRLVEQTAGGAAADGLMDVLKAYKNTLEEGGRTSARGEHVEQAPPDSDTESNVESAPSESTAPSSVLHDTTIRRLQREIQRLHHSKSFVAEQVDACARRCESLREEVARLSADGLLKTAKSNQLREAIRRASGDRNMLLLQTPPGTPARMSPISSRSSTPTPLAHSLRRAGSHSFAHSPLAPATPLSDSSSAHGSVRHTPVGMRERGPGFHPGPRSGYTGRPSARPRP